MNGYAALAVTFLLMVGGIGLAILGAYRDQPIAVGVGIVCVMPGVLFSPLGRPVGRSGGGGAGNGWIGDGGASAVAGISGAETAAKAEATVAGANRRHAVATRTQVVAGRKQRG